MTTTEYVAGEVRAAMARKRVTVTDLAEATGVSRRHMTRLLNGQATLDVEQLARISQALDVSYESLWPKGDDAA